MTSVVDILLRSFFGRTHRKRPEHKGVNFVLLGTVAYASCPGRQTSQAGMYTVCTAQVLRASRQRVQIYSFAYTSRSIHHSHYSYVSYYLVPTPVISLLTKPTPQGSYWLVYCSFVPQHVFLSFLAARSSFS